MAVAGLSLPCLEPEAGLGWLSCEAGVTAVAVAAWGVRAASRCDVLFMVVSVEACLWGLHLCVAGGRY